MKRTLQFCSLFFSIVFFSGCSLLEVSLDSKTEPLTTNELNTRILTREYSRNFFSEVESAADQIAATYAKDDTVHQSYVLLWKINAEEGIQQSVYQASPQMALIDSWIFTAQMEQFFSADGKGAELFDNDLAYQTSIKLNIEVETLAKQLLDTNFTSAQEFVTSFVEANKFNDLMMKRTPALKSWLKYQNIDETEALVNMGTMPEALGDVSDRLTMVSEQTPKLMTWKAQLITLNSNLDGEEIQKTLESLRGTSESFQDFVNNNPEYMQQLAEQMSLELQPILEQIDNMTNDKLDQLSAERIALEQMVEKEREEITIIIDQQRVKLTADLEQLSEDIVTLAIDKIIDLVKSTIIYFILFILVIFFAPLALGYYLGKRASIKKH